MSVGVLYQKEPIATSQLYLERLGLGKEQAGIDPIQDGGKLVKQAFAGREAR